MALNSFKCNCLKPLHFKGLTALLCNELPRSSQSDRWVPGKFGANIATVRDTLFIRRLVVHKLLNHTGDYRSEDAVCVWNVCYSILYRLLCYASSSSPFAIIRIIVRDTLQYANIQLTWSFAPILNMLFESMSSSTVIILYISIIYFPSSDGDECSEALNKHQIISIGLCISWVVVRTLYVRSNKHVLNTLINFKPLCET